MAIDDAARKASKEDTEDHRFKVRALLLKVSAALGARGRDHDDSKLEQPELDLFAEWGPRLKRMEYGTKEYQEALDHMGEALKHHYEHNRHHPEHFDGGVDGMNLIDLVEMICDWKAASLRMKNGGNFLDSVEHNRKRFDLSPQLTRIIANTADFFEESGEPRLPDKYKGD